MSRERSLAAALALLLTAGAARAGLFGRSKVESLWAAKPPAVDADDARWDDESAYEADGLSVQAMNDGSALYLLLTAHASEGRDQLSGEARQDVALYFTGADGKSRAWGMRLPFSHRAPLTEALKDPLGVDPQPEFVEYRGAAVSTDTCPADILDRLGGVGRRPIWEFKIPLKRLAVGPEGDVNFDYVISAPLTPARKRPEPKAAEREESPTDGAAPPGGGRHGGGGDEKSSASKEADIAAIWYGQTYQLTLRLALDPSLPRP